MKSFLKIAFLVLISFCLFGKEGSFTRLQKEKAQTTTSIQHVDLNVCANGPTSNGAPVRKLLLRRFHHGIDESALTIPDYSRGQVYSCIDISLNILGSYQSSHTYFFSPYKALPVQQVILSSFPLRAPPIC